MLEARTQQSTFIGISQVTRIALVLTLIEPESPTVALNYYVKVDSSHYKIPKKGGGGGKKHHKKRK